MQPQQVFLQKFLNRKLTQIDIVNMTIYALFFAVLVFGKYGPAYDAANFIYEQF